MESLEELSDTTDEECTKKPHSENSLLWNIKAKEIWTTKTQNYFMKVKRTKNILIQLAFSAGLGSMWRFPYLCQQNGGGSFILMYFFMLLLFGIPLLYMEMIIGQWLRVDNIRVWKQLVPWLGGVGYASTMVCVLVSLYNSAILSWSLFYLGNSFNYPLPWDYCPMVKNINVTDFSCLQTVTHQYFWYHTTLEASGDIEEGIQSLVLKLSLGLFAIWVFLFFIIVTGINMSMLMMIFSIILPYIILFCLFIKGLFLEGAASSLRRMVTTELSALSSLDLWRQAGGHVLYSLGLGMGTTITSSYEAGRDNFVKAASCVALGNLVLSMLTTSIIFVVLGFWASTSGHACVEKSVSRLIELISHGMLSQQARPPEHILHMHPLDYLNWIIHLPRHLQYQVIHLSLSCSIKVQKEKLMESPGLTFAAFSQIVSLLHYQSFWAILFFLALFITGLGTLIRILENIVLSLQNSSIFINYPRMVPVVICLGCLLGSLVFSSHAGVYIMSLFDDHLVPLTLVIIVTFQNMALTWIYGTSRLREEIVHDLGGQLRPSFTFSYVTLPGLLALLTICLLPLHHKVPPHYTAWNESVSQEVKLPYPKSALGWVSFLSFLAFLPILAYPLYHWWYFQDPIISDTLPEPASFKKTATATPQPLQWPKHPMRKPSSNFQKKTREMLFRGHNLNVGKGNERSSWFSMPRITSLFSLWGSSLITSKQVSPMCIAVDNHMKHGEPAEEKPPDSSAQ